nr:ribonuclease H-like domain-containing protein [Tanacetum cinerariifolium]
MYDEYNTLVKNGTWILVPRPTDANLVRSMWLFRHKFHADGTSSRYKARFVINGSNQQLGVDIDETFSPVFKPSTIHTVLSLAISRQWPIHQLDVKNAFLNGDLSETVYMHQPPVDTDSKLGPNGIPVQDPTLYRSLAEGFSILPLLAQICPMQFIRYTDADWAGCPSTHSTEAEYQGVANVVAETASIHNLLRELHSPFLTATLVYCDNVSAIYMLANPVQHQRTKHIKIDIHFVRDMVKAGHVWVLHVPSRFQYADIFTKGLPSSLFEDFRSSLSVRPPPAQTTGAY